MEKKSQVGIIVGPGKGLWLIHHMIANDHPWSSMTIYVDPESKTSWAPALVTYPSTFSGVPFHLLPEDVDLLVGFVQFKLCFLLSDLVFTRSTLGRIKTLVWNGCTTTSFIYGKILSPMKNFFAGSRCHFKPIVQARWILKPITKCCNGCKLFNVFNCISLYYLWKKL